MGSKNKRKKNKNNIGVVKHNTKKKKTRPVKTQTLLDNTESKKLDSLSQKQDPIPKTELEKLFEKVKAKVEALKAPGTTNAHSIPSHDISASTPGKAYPLEKTIENREQDCLIPNVSQRAEVTAEADPLLVPQKSEVIKKKKRMKKKTTDVKIQTLPKQSDNITPVVGCLQTSLDPVKESLVQELPKYEKKKKMKKEKKKKTTDIKIQTLPKQSDNISPTVGCFPTSLNPVKESVVQELPEYEVPEPVSEFGSNPNISKFEIDDITVVKQKKKRMKKKTTDVKIQTLPKQSDNITPVVGCLQTSLDPVKESLVQELPKYEKKKKMKKKKKKTTNIKIQTLPKQSDNISPTVGCFPTSLNPVKESVVQELPEYEKKKKKKKKTTDIKIQTLLERSVNISPIAGRCPTCFNPVKESLLQELLEYKNTKLKSLPQKLDPISKKDLKKSLEEVKVNTEALEDAETSNARTIPFHDMSASTPDKAYPLEKIIEKEEWDCLGDLLKFSQGAKLTPDDYPIFVCNRVQKLEDIKDEYEKSRVASVLQYITHLIKYKDKHTMANYESVKNHKFPSILEEKFRTMFNESCSKYLSYEKRKFLINNVLVLTLLVDGYHTDATDIAKDLRMNVLELKKQYEQLGCKIVHEKPVLLATLAVPLEFPVFRWISKKRKR